MNKQRRKQLSALSDKITDLTVDIGWITTALNEIFDDETEAMENSRGGRIGAVDSPALNNISDAADEVSEALDLLIAARDSIDLAVEP